MKGVWLALFTAILLFGGNLLFSIYALDTLKEHSQKLRLYKSLKEENLKLRASIEKLLNVKELRKYAFRKGFRPFDWEELVIYIITEPSEKGRTKKRSK